MENSGLINLTDFKEWSFDLARACGYFGGYPSVDTQRILKTGTM